MLFAFLPLATLAAITLVSVAGVALPKVVFVGLAAIAVGLLAGLETRRGIRRWRRATLCVAARQSSHAGLDRWRDLRGRFQQLDFRVAVIKLVLAALLTMVVLALAARFLKNAI